MMPIEEKKTPAIWRYLGAMLTEKKDGSMAASFTRVLGVITFMCWAVMMFLQMFNPEAWQAPSEVTYVLLSLVGIKGAKDVAKGLKGRSAYE